MDLNSKEELEDIERTSKKVETISKKEGLREGISAGRDSNFQESFDKGYLEGFKNGFLLGKYKGFLTAGAKQTDTEVKLHPLLENTSGGSCEICKNGETIESEEKIDALIDIQENSYKKNIETLNSCCKEESLDEK